MSNRNNRFQHNHDRLTINLYCSSHWQRGATHEEEKRRPHSHVHHDQHWHEPADRSGWLPNWENRIDYGVKDAKRCTNAKQIYRHNRIRSSHCVRERDENIGHYVLNVVAMRANGAFHLVVRRVHGQTLCGCDNGVVWFVTHLVNSCTVRSFVQVLTLVRIR